MKTKALTLLLSACLMVSPALADTWAGSVSASATTELTCPADGTLSEFALEVGQTVSAGETVGAIRATKVFSPIDGTVAAIHLEPGDTASGTVLEISPLSRYTLTCTSDSYAKTPSNALIHSGETLYVRCTADGTHRAVARVTTIDGTNYQAEVTGGELYVGETVFLYRQDDFDVDSLVGKGTVTSHDTLAVSGEGVILELRAGVGDFVERGQWLFSTASAEKTALTVPADGVVTAVSAKVGASVREDAYAATIATAVCLRVDVSADDVRRFARGSAWYYTRNDDPHETHYTATVERVLTNEADASATVVLKPQEAGLPIGLGIILTDEKE